MSSFNAENLTISVPGNSCNKKCPYCISKITNPIEFNDLLWKRNLSKLSVLAKSSTISSVLITGKGEPTLNIPKIENICEYFSDFPIEIQTNGLLFIDNPLVLKNLFDIGISTISISMDFIKTDIENQLNNLKEFFKLNALYDLNIRLAVNFTDHVPEKYLDITTYTDLCKEYNINQLLFRNIVNPKRRFSKNEVTEWIDKNSTGKQFEKFVEHFCFYKLNGHSINDEENPNIIRITKFGMPIYDIDNISISFSDFCIQEKSNSNDIRSLIYQANGHLYTSWNSMASIIF